MSTRSGPPPSIAVALHYDGEAAPRVTASGRGEVAEAICRIAAAHGVPHWEDPQLAVALAQIELGAEVPVELYRAVAEVIAFAYLVAGAAPTPRAGPGGADPD
jgi:flagellar biosynthesis protein